MIKRKRKSAPKELTDVSDAFNKEKAAVEAWINSSFNKKDKPNFKLYKHKKVPEILEKMFEGKCAYCESPYTRTQPLDVEHFRPKSEVVVELTDGSIKKVGIYAHLAMEWENLLPSCIDCNRARYQLVFRKEKDSEERNWKRLKQGKANSFPIFDESKRAKSPNFSEQDEEILLLNPCIDRPDRYLSYHESGVVVAKGRKSGTKRVKEIHWQKALRSIEVYGLNRKGLVDMRKEYILRLQMRFSLILKLIHLSQQVKDDMESFRPKVADATLDALIKKTSSSFNKMLEGELDLLVRLTKPDMPYSALAKQFIKGFLTEFELNA